MSLPRRAYGIIGLLLMHVSFQACTALSFLSTRRTAILSVVTTTCTTCSGLWPEIARAAGADTKIDGSFDVDEFLRTGIVAQPMGVSGQSGKSRPETGVVFRDGSEVSQDKSGNVLAEILVQSASGVKIPVLATFVSKWPLATGSVFDVECRNTKGESAYLAVTGNTKTSNIKDVSDEFFVKELTGPTGRFSMYGTPTDIKIRSSTTQGNYRIMDMTFSTLSQSTQTEIPRRARIIATIPENSAQAVVLVSSASALRWNKVEPEITQTVESFRATTAPTSSLRVRAKERGS